MKRKCVMAVIAAVLFAAAVPAVIASASELSKDITISGSGQIMAVDAGSGNGKETHPEVGKETHPEVGKESHPEVGKESHPGVGTVTKTSSTPKTGDESDITVYMIAMFFCLVILLFMLLARWHLEDASESCDL